MEGEAQPLSKAAYNQVDVYQVGKLVYEILTGSNQLPAYGGSTEDSVTEIVPPSVVNETLPTDVDEVVQRALAADPADRYQTVQDFWDDLRIVIDKYGLQHNQTVGEPSYYPDESVPIEEAKTISIADIYLQYANRSANKGYDSKAQTYYEAALERVPTNGTGSPNKAAVLYEYANFLADQGRHEQAIKRYRQALELEPERPEFHNNIAVSYAELEEYEESLAHCQEALKIDEERPETHTNMATILQDLDRYDEAITHYQRAIELAPDQPEAHNNWGQLLMKTGRHNKAATRFEEALAIDPEYAEAHVNYATLLRQMGRDEEAKRHVKEAMRLRPEYIDGKYRNLLKDVTSTPSSHGRTTTVA
jgi:tetratricopeptide (TPR) repeat protein